MKTNINAACAAVAGSVPAIAGAQAVAHQGGYGEHMMGWGGWIAGPVMMIFGLAVLIAVVVLIVRLFSHMGATDPRYDSAMAILRERFAKGEIDEAQFTQMKRNLEHEG